MSQHKAVINRLMHSAIPSTSSKTKAAQPTDDDPLTPEDMELIEKVVSIREGENLLKMSLFSVISAVLNSRKSNKPLNSINSLEWSSVLSKKTDGQLGLERIAIEGGNKKIADREEVFPLNEDVLKE